jgi:hypothetical protein
MIFKYQNTTGKGHGAIAASELRRRGGQVSAQQLTQIISPNFVW